MTTLQIKSSVIQEKIVEIPVPFFAKAKDGYNFIGLVDEKTIIRVYQGLSYTSIVNSNPDNFENGKLIEAFESWELMTEGEFFDKYDQVIQSISLTPIIQIK